MWGYPDDLARSQDEAGRQQWLWKGVAGFNRSCKVTLYWRTLNVFSFRTLNIVSITKSNTGQKRFLYHSCMISVRGESGLVGKLVKNPVDQD